MRETVTALIQTLNNIEVRGKDNLDQLLGCILLLESLLEKEEPEKTEVIEEEK